MRCRKCSIDVSENTALCPLCGERVINDPPVLPELEDIPYPKYALPAQPEKDTVTLFGAAKHLTRAAAVSGILLNAAGRISGSKKLMGASGALCVASAAVSLASCVTEKGELMKGATPLLINTCLAAAFAVPDKKNRTPNEASLLSVGACAVINAAAFASNSQKMKDQYAAVFRIYGKH